MSDPAHVRGHQSLYGTLTRLLGGTGQAHLPWLVAALLVGTSGLLAAARLDRTSFRLPAAAVCGTTGLLVSPISWTHHWVWVLPAAVAGLGARPGVDSASRSSQ